MTHAELNPKSDCPGGLRLLDDRKSLGGGPRRQVRRCQECGNLVVNDGDLIITDGADVLPGAPLDYVGDEPYPGYSDGWWF